MFSWIAANLANVIISAIVIAAVVVAVVSIVRDRKRGKNSCGCGCEGCMMAGTCHKPEKEERQTS